MTIKFTAFLAEPSTEGSACIHPIDGQLPDFQAILDKLTAPRTDGNTVRRVVLMLPEGNLIVHIGEWEGREKFLEEHRGVEGLSATTKGYIRSLEAQPDLPGIVIYADGATKLVSPNDWVYNKSGNVMFKPVQAKGADLGAVL